MTLRILFTLVLLVIDVQNRDARPTRPVQTSHVNQTNYELSHTFWTNARQKAKRSSHIHDMSNRNDDISSQRSTRNSSPSTSSDVQNRDVRPTRPVQTSHVNQTNDELSHTFWTNARQKAKSSSHIHDMSNRNDDLSSQRSTRNSSPSTSSGWKHTISRVMLVGAIIVLASVVIAILRRHMNRRVGRVTVTRSVPRTSPSHHGPKPYPFNDDTAVNMTPENMAAKGVQQTAGPIPEQSPTEATQPPPYSSSNDSALTHEARNEDIPEDGDKITALITAAANMSRDDLPNNAIVRPPAYGAHDISGFTNPAYEEL